jgi:hypothetical protein
MASGTFRRIRSDVVVTRDNRVDEDLQRGLTAMGVG